MRIMIGALSGWQYADRRSRCLATWFPDARTLGLDAVFLMGIEALTAAERHADLLLLPCPDPYIALPQRTRCFCQWALTNNGWDYLFKCDDDTYVAAQRLAAYEPLGRDYIGAEWTPGVAYGSGGGGYLLSRRAAAIVAEKLTHEQGAEDLLVGEVLRAAGVKLSIEPRFTPFANEARRPRSDNAIITAHGITGDLFRQCHFDVGYAR